MSKEIPTVILYSNGEVIVQMTPYIEAFCWRFKSITEMEEQLGVKVPFHLDYVKKMTGKTPKEIIAEAKNLVMSNLEISAHDTYTAVRSPNTKLHVTVNNDGTIEWFGLIDQTPNAAKEYAYAILKACEIAEEKLNDSTSAPI
jgi:hypothetical protein